MPRPSDSDVHHNRMKKSIHSVLFLFAGLLVAFAGAWIALHPKELNVHIGLQSPAARGYLQAFPYAGGYNEATSRQVPLEAGDPHDYHLVFKSARVPKVLRIDPGSTPGAIDLRYIAFSNGHQSARLEGAPLKQAMTLRHDLAWASPSGGLVATGTDPWLEIAVPDGILAASRQTRHAGWTAFVLGALFCIGIMVFQAGRVMHASRVAVREQPWLWSCLTAMVAGIVVLSVFGLPPTGLVQDPLRGLRYGAQLFLAATLLAVIGAALLDMLGTPSRLPRSSRLFLGLAIGQCGLIAYLYIRSLLPAIGVAGVGAWEVWVIAILCGYYLFRRHRGHHGLLHAKDLSVQLGLLAAICLVIADRELPRQVMLSSDPDTHAFLSRQILSLGFLPQSGDLAFDYPGGSAFLGAMWSWLSGLDPRNTITALPLIACLTGALLLAEAVAQHHSRPDARIASLLTALALTTAALLFPVFLEYAHMEGAGRQISFMFAAAIPALWIGSDRVTVGSGRTIIAPLSLVLLTLAALNPIGPIMPGIVLAAFWLEISLRNRRLHPSILAAPLAVALLFLDPYYQGLLAGAGSNPKITVISNYRELSGSEILARWPGYYVQTKELGTLLFRLLPQHPMPTFALLLAAIGLPAFLLGKRALKTSILAATAALLLILLGCAGLFAVLRTDPRAYLLADYFGFSIAQYKAILLILLAAAAAAAAIMKGWTRQTIFVVGMGAFAAAWGMRTQQEFMYAPRHAYCGSMGCASENDMAVLDMMRKAMPRGADSRRVLLPNTPHNTHQEAWIFPVAGSRAQPFAGTLDPAFFYYQGDRAFTTQSYMENVCTTFNRRWLLQHGVGYVFLPEGRDSACIMGMESLIESEKVIFRSGNAYLLEISPTAPELLASPQHSP